VVFTFAHIWDGTTIEWNWAAVWFMVLVGATFAALQGAVTRLLGLAGMPILGLLYLMAPAVSGQPPELLNPEDTDPALGETDRARAAARDVLRPAIDRALTRAGG
jgi:hypothetical protein